MAAATFMGISFVCPGFPSGTLVHPLLIWTRLELKETLGRVETDKEHFRVCRSLATAISKNEIPFTLGQSHFLMGEPPRPLRTGFVSWGFSSMESYLHYRYLPEAVKNEIVFERRLLLLSEMKELLNDYSPLTWSADMYADWAYSKGDKFRVENLL